MWAVHNPTPKQSYTYEKSNKKPNGFRVLVCTIIVTDKISKPRHIDFSGITIQSLTK
jgi:hypothetical protein